MLNDSPSSVSGWLALHGGVPVRHAPIESNIHVSECARGRVQEILASGQLSLYHNGPWARRFEEAFASFHGDDVRAIAVNSGTSALHLALTVAGVGPGDEVIVPALCFVAAATAVVQNGAVPIICDAEPGSLTLDVAKAEALVTPRTKAILPVHFWGYPTDSERLRAVCEHHGLVLLEDCAQAMGATVNGRLVGTFGNFAAFAFSVRKHISCGEGGMVLCTDPNAYRRLREVSNYGKGPGWDDYLSFGFNYRMAEVPAVIGLDGLERVRDEIAQRQSALAHYRERVADTPLRVVPDPPWGRSAAFKCPVLLPDDFVDLRAEMVRAIAAENVSCRIPHRPLFTIPWLADYLRARGVHRCAEECQVAAAAHRRLIEIETGPHLPHLEAERTGDALMKVWKYYSDHRAAGARR